MMVLEFPLHRYMVAWWLTQPTRTADALVRNPGEDCLFPSYRNGIGVQKLWERFVENQCGGRRGRGGRPDLVGRRGGKESHKRNSILVHSLEFTLWR